MKAVFDPCTLKGSVTAPPSKSAAHRSLIAAYLSGSECTIDNIALSEDIKATISCLEALGADITVSQNSAYVKPALPKGNTLNCSESGSTLRFLIPPALKTNRKITFCGSRTLFERPLSVYEKIAEENGFLFEKGDGCLTVKGSIKSGVYKIDGSISSQFITGLLFALPTLENDSIIEIMPPFESRSYVLITLDILKKFGISAELDGLMIKIPGGQKFSAENITVEGDYSNAAYIDAFNEAGGSITINGLGKTNQGDAIYKKLYAELSEFSTIDISDCPDLGPVLFTVAALKNGARFTGTKRLELKESDRKSAMCEELKKFGINISCSENEVLVPKSEIQKPQEPLSAHNDHRILMALCVLLSLTGGEIYEAESVKKSFPDYFEKIKKLGAKFKLTEE